MIKIEKGDNILNIQEFNILELLNDIAFIFIPQSLGK